MKVQSGCRASRGSLMNTFPATWNKAMVRATRFLITNITIRRITWRRRGTHWSYQLWKWTPQQTFSHAAKTLWPPDLPWIWLQLWHSPAGPSRYQTPLPSRRWTRCRYPEHFCGPHRATRELQFPLERSEQKEPLWKKKKNTERQRQTESLKVTDGADDHQNGQNPHQHLRDVTNDDHHDQGQNWKTRGLVLKDHRVSDW